MRSGFVVADRQARAPRPAESPGAAAAALAPPRLGLARRRSAIVRDRGRHRESRGGGSSSALASVIERCTRIPRPSLPALRHPERSHRRGPRLTGSSPQSSAALRWLRKAGSGLPGRHARTAAIHRPSCESPRMADGVDALVDPVQPTGRDPLIAGLALGQSRDSSSCRRDATPCCEPRSSPTPLGRGSFSTHADEKGPTHRSSPPAGARSAALRALVDDALDGDLERLAAARGRCGVRAGRPPRRSAARPPALPRLRASSGPRKRWAKAPVSRATKPMPTIRITVETTSPPVVVG